MNPQRFTESNIVMRAPPNMPECADIHAYSGADADKQAVIITAWRPTPEELVRLNLGEPVYLTIYGGGMPPVSLSVDSPWRQIDPEQA